MTLEDNKGVVKTEREEDGENQASNIIQPPRSSQKKRKARRHRTYDEKSYLDKIRKRDDDDDHSSSTHSKGHNSRGSNYPRTRDHYHVRTRSSTKRTRSSLKFQRGEIAILILLLLRPLEISRRVIRPNKIGKMDVIVLGYPAVRQKPSDGTKSMA